MPTATKAQSGASAPASAATGDEWFAPLSWDAVRAVADGRMKGPMPEDFNGPGFPPPEPCQHRPGTEGKIMALAARYAKRQALFHPLDAR